jgi:hypothetical protein
MRGSKPVTGLYVICSSRPQAQLSKRRGGYREHPLEGLHVYAREAFSPDVLGQREKDIVRMLPQWIEDVRSVAQDPRASFFFVDMQHRESLTDAIRRGLALPLVARADPVVLVDRERRSASGM